jgi:phosphotransferase system IIB component
MAKDFTKTAEGIFAAVGGKGNIKNVVHCITRLRFTLHDQAKASDEAARSTPGVVSVVKAGGLYQVVIGNDVFDVYAELEKLGVPTGAAWRRMLPGQQAKKRLPFSSICLSTQFPACSGLSYQA